MERAEKDVFPPVTWNPVEASKEHLLTLEDWSDEAEELGRTVDRFWHSYVAAKSSLYELFGWSSVFQGVIIASIAQANYLTCHNSFPLFILSSLTTFGTFWATLFKLFRISKDHDKYLSYRQRLRDLEGCISRLREQGSDFDIANALNTDLAFKNHRPSNSLGTFVRRWILSSYGAVLLLLVSFSVAVLALLAQVLC